MEENNIQKFGNNKAILKLSLIVSVLLSLVMVIGIIYARMREKGTANIFLGVFSLRTLFTFLSQTLTVFVLFKFQFWAIKRKKNRKYKSSFVIKVLLSSLVIIFLLSVFTAQANWWLYTPKNTSLDMLYSIHFFYNLILLMVISLITTMLLLSNRTQQRMIENQRLSLENLQNRYEALKNQIDPHFLFNSLNTLNGLIDYNKEKAHDYLEQLSSVFCYTMQSNKIIQLKNELDFVQSYFYLMKIRYDEGLQVTYNIDEKYHEYYILPFGLQILIENCIKHNVVSSKSPLLITLETAENETIKIKNTIHLKTDVTSSGIGLSNLNERYQLVFNKEIVISQDETFFTVEIPLVKNIEEYSFKFKEILL